MLHRHAAGLGFWAAAAGAVLSILFAGLAIAFPAAPWAGIEAYARTFNPLQMASTVPALLLTPAMVVLMAGFHYCAPPEKRVFTLIAVGLACIYTAIISTNYYLQLFVVRLNILAGDLEGLTLLALPNLHSIFFALEVLGYGFLSLALLAVSPALGGGKLHTWMRRLFILNGLAGVYGVVVAPFDRPALIFAGLGLWSVIFPAAMILSGIFFRRVDRVPAAGGPAANPEER